MIDQSDVKYFVLTNCFQAVHSLWMLTSRSGREHGNVCTISPALESPRYGAVQSRVRGRRADWLLF